MIAHLKRPGLGLAISSLVRCRICVGILLGPVLLLDFSSVMSFMIFDSLVWGKIPSKTRGGTLIFRLNINNLLNT